MSWQIGVATGACIHQSIRETLSAIQLSGLTGIEVSTPPGHFDPWELGDVLQLQHGLQAAGLRAISIHAPFGGRLDLADPNAANREAAIDAVLTAAAALKRLGGRMVIVHPSDLERSKHHPGARLADSRTSLMTLADSFRQEGLTLVVESPLPHLIGGHPDEFRWLLQRLDSSVRVCLDTGHTALGGYWHAFLSVSDGRTAHVHAHDNHGHRDDHLPPGEGRIDWREIGRTLAAVNFDGWIMLELMCRPTEDGVYFRTAAERTRELLHQR